MDSRELDFIQAVFLKRFLGGILVVGGNIQNTPYFFKRMDLK
ncbi:hypothetical protein ACLF9O_03400 [Helicobacter pylori]